MAITSSRTPRANGLVTTMRASLRDHLTDAPSYERFVLAVAAIFIVSAVLHAVVFVVDDRPWAGRGSWRQPLSFSLAMTLVVTSLAWMMSFLPRRRALGWAVSGTLGAATVGTVFLIALQTWRGHAAFFPEDLPFDQAMWTGIQVGVGLIVLAIMAETIWAFTTLNAPPAIRWAIRTGLLLMIAGFAMGGAMIAEGLRQEETGPVDSPVTFGEAGYVVFPHLLALHSLLVLSALAWLLSFTALSARHQSGVVWAATAGYVALIAVTLTQALGGRAPFDLTGFVAVIFWLSVAIVIGTFVAAVAWASSGAQPRGA